MSFQYGAKYAWRVEALNAATGSPVLKSSVRQLIYKLGIKIALGNVFVSGTLHYEFADPGEAFGKPLANVSIKLVVKYVLKYKQHVTYSKTTNVTGSLVVPANELTAAMFNDKDKVLATAKTGSDGKFLFNFWTYDTTGLIVKDQLSGSTGGEFYDYYKGDLYRAYRIVVENPYYLSPTTDIHVKPGEMKNLGNVFAYVRSYALRVKVVPHPNIEIQATHAPLAGMTVYLLRKTRPLFVPHDEGKPRPDTAASMFGMEVIGTGISSGKAGEDGTFIFRRLVKNVGPNDQYHLFAVTDTSQGKFNYKASLAKTQFENPQDEATFNDEYKYKVFGTDLVATPLMPVVRGRVVRAVTGEPVHGAKVQLMKLALAFWTEERKAITPPDGRFRFPFLFSLFDANGNPIGPVRGLRITKTGYKERKFAVPATGAVMKLGDQWVDENIQIEPGATVKGKVVDESGEGANSWITIGNSLAVQAKSIAMHPNTFKWLPAAFQTQVERLPVPQRVIIDPMNQSYLRETTFVTINQENVDLGTFTVYRKKHKIILMVREETPNMPFAVWPKIQGAKVRIKDLNLEAMTDQKGEVKFEFENDASQFTFIATAPTGKYYEKKLHTMQHVVSRYWKFEPVGMKKATFISGHVYVGKDKTPVDKARVFIDLGSNDTKIETETGMDGTYLLPNVPIGAPLTVWATKPSLDTTIVGDSVNVV
ncbi:MAG: hypothetical protein AAB393_00390, partial [Bacteroidota bacterium]